MAGVGASLELRGIKHLNNVLDRLGGVDPQRLMSVLGNIVEKQTVARIIDGKASPAGAPWQPWSPSYAKSRHGNQNLLQSSGDLVDSIQSICSVSGAEIGSNLVYAASHQFGDAKRGIPQREFLGVSNDNIVDLHNTLEDWADNMIQGAV